VEIRAIENAMIINEQNPILSELIPCYPQMFSSTEIIGVFDGEYLCANFVNNWDELDKITLFENFSAISDRHKFCKLYKKWQQQVPILEIKETNGVNFSTASTYLHIDVSDNDLYNFFIENYSKIKNKMCVSFYAFGGNACNTLLVSKLILECKCFPFFIHRGIIFAALNKKIQARMVQRLSNRFMQNKIKFKTENIITYDNEYKIITTNMGWDKRKTTIFFK